MPPTMQPISSLEMTSEKFHWAQSIVVFGRSRPKKAAR